MGKSKVFEAADAPKKSDLSRAFAEDGALKTHVGGQALIEGVMMRGKFNWAVAVREPSGASSGLSERKRVVLPDPVEPTKTQKSPSFTSKETPSNTRSPAPPRRALPSAG